jgi:hypothetical protein
VNTDLKQDWKDAPHWSQLYQENSLRSPVHSLPCSPGGMRKFLKKAGITVTQYVEYTGFSFLGKYQEMNPRVPLWVFGGLMLEAKREGMLQ